MVKFRWSGGSKRAGAVSRSARPVWGSVSRDRSPGSHPDGRTKQIAHFHVVRRGTRRKAFSTRVQQGDVGDVCVLRRQKERERGSPLSELTGLFWYAAPPLVAALHRHQRRKHCSFAPSRNPFLSVGANRGRQNSPVESQYGGCTSRDCRQGGKKTGRDPTVRLTL